MGLLRERKKKTAMSEEKNEINKNPLAFFKDLVLVKSFQHRLDTLSIQEMSQEQWKQIQ